jgi:hypothetical protein
MGKIKGWKKIIDTKDKIEYSSSKHNTNKISIIKSENSTWKWNLRFIKRGYYAGNGKFFKTKAQSLKFATIYMRSHPNG